MSDIVIYVRTSTVEQSLEGQREVCEQFAKENGYNIVHIYEDHGYSSDDVGPGFIEMREFLADNPSVTILAVTPNRLSRNEDIFTECMRDHKVRFVRE